MDKVDFIVNVEENSCHLKFPVLTLDQDWRWIFQKSFNERIMWWFRNTNEGCYLFVGGWFRNYSEFFSDVVEDDAHNYLVLIVNIQKSECHLDNEIFVSTNNIARNIDFWGKTFAQMIIVRWFRRAVIHLFCPYLRFNMQ